MSPRQMARMWSGQKNWCIEQTSVFLNFGHFEGIGDEGLIHDAVSLITKNETEQSRPDELLPPGKENKCYTGSNVDCRFAVPSSRWTKRERPAVFLALPFIGVIGVLYSELIDFFLSSRLSFWSHAYTSYVFTRYVVVKDEFRSESSKSSKVRVAKVSEQLRRLRGAGPRLLLRMF